MAIPGAPAPTNPDDGKALDAFVSFYTSPDMRSLFKSVIPAMAKSLAKLEASTKVGITSEAKKNASFDRHVAKIEKDANVLASRLSDSQRGIADIIKQIKDGDSAAGASARALLERTFVAINEDRRTTNKTLAGTLTAFASRTSKDIAKAITVYSEHVDRRVSKSEKGLQLYRERIDKERAAADDKRAEKMQKLMEKATGLTKEKSALDKRKEQADAGLSLFKKTLAYYTTNLIPRASRSVVGFALGKAADLIGPSDATRGGMLNFFRRGAASALNSASVSRKLASNAEKIELEQLRLKSTGDIEGITSRVSAEELELKRKERHLEDRTKHIAARNAMIVSEKDATLRTHQVTQAALDSTHRDVLGLQPSVQLSDAQPQSSDLIAQDIAEEDKKIRLDTASSLSSISELLTKNFDVKLSELFGAKASVDKLSTQATKSKSMFDSLESVLMSPTFLKSALAVATSILTNKAFLVTVVAAAGFAVGNAIFESGKLKEWLPGLARMDDKDWREFGVETGEKSKQESDILNAKIKDIDPTDTPEKKAQKKDVIERHKLYETLKVPFDTDPLSNMMTSEGVSEMRRLDAMSKEDLLKELNTRYTTAPAKIKNQLSEFVRGLNPLSPEQYNRDLYVQQGAAIEKYSKTDFRTTAREATVVPSTLTEMYRNPEPKNNINAKYGSDIAYLQPNPLRIPAASVSAHRENEARQEAKEATDVTQHLNAKIWESIAGLPPVLERILKAIPPPATNVVTTPADLYKVRP